MSESKLVSLCEWEGCSQPAVTEIYSTYRAHSTVHRKVCQEHCDRVCVGPYWNERQYEH